MFRDNINKPIDPISEEYVKTLYRVENEPDYSFTCLAIALFKKRIPDYKGIKGIYRNIPNQLEAFDDFTARVSQYDPSIPHYFYYTYSNSAYNDEESLKKFLEERYPDFLQKETISRFVKDHADNDCVVLYHETKNIAGIFINTRDLRVYHMLLTFIPLYYPAIFTESPIQDDEKPLLKSVLKQDASFFLNEIQNILSPYVEEFKRLQINGMLHSLHEQKLHDARTKLDAQRIEEENCRQRYHNAIARYRELNVIYQGLVITEQFDDSEKELLEFLCANKQIMNLTMDGPCIKFTVATTLTNYSENAWRVFSNAGWIYDGRYGDGYNPRDTFKDKNNRKILLDDIFSDSPNFSVRMAGNYTFNLDDCSVVTDSGYNYVAADVRYKSYLPNPHLKIYACLGGYRDEIPEKLEQRDYIGAFEMAIASAGSVNLDETDNVFRPFLGYILSSDQKVLVRRDGTEYTPEEALLWLVDKKEKENETNGTNG